MSKYDKEREKLGLRSGNSSPSAKISNTSSSKYAQERERLYNPPVRNQPSIEVGRQVGLYNPFQQQQENESFVSRLEPAVKSLETYGPPDPKAPSLRDQLSTNREQRFDDVSGSKIGSALTQLADPLLTAVDALAITTNKPAKFLGQFYTPGGGLTAMTAATKGVGELISKVAPTLGLGKGLLPTIGREAIKEGVVGAQLGAGQSLASNPKGGLEEAGKQALQGALYGAGGGALLSGGAKALSMVGDKAAEGLIGSRLGAASAIETAANSPVTGRLKFGDNETYINKVMSDITPIVNERMTPPLENPAELAKWLKPHLGDVSLNEIRKFSYDEMQQLATEVRSSMDMYTVARQAAKERGYNLDELLSGKTPDPRKEVDRLRMGNVSGAIEAPQNARIALSNKDLPDLDVTPTTAPKEHWFTSLFGDKPVGITPGSDGQAMIDTHVVGRARERSSLLANASEKVSSARNEIVDRFAPFKEISENTYNSAMDSTRANNLANITIKDKFVDMEGNVLGKSLKDVYSGVPRGMKNIADRYVILRDAVSRMDRGLKVYGDKQWFPQTSEAAAKMVSELESAQPWLKQFGDDWNQFNRNRQDLWVQSGIVSQDLINKLRQTNPNYAPMMRQQTANSLKNKIALNTSRSGFSGQRAPINRAVGSTKKIIEPAQGMIESTGSSYNAMMRNRAMISLYDEVKANPEKYKGIVEIVDDTADARQASLKAINEALAENGPDGVAELLNGELDALFKRSKQLTGGREGTVTVLLNGEPRKLKVSDPSLLKAIEGIAPEQLTGILNVASALSKGIKFSATGPLAPLQGVKLAVRDVPIAFAQSKDKKRFLFDFGHAAISQIADWLPTFVPGAEKVGHLARQYYRAGGGYEAYLKGDSRIRAVSSDITRDPLLSGRNIVKTLKQVQPLRPLKGLGDAMENVPRIAAFNAAMRKTGWSRDPESVRGAVDAAREATVNWSRRGAKGAQLEAILPYSNAAVQGTYRLMKRFKEQPVAATALILGIAGSKIAAYEKFKDDPDYQNRSRFEKGIPYEKTKDGKFRTIPVEPTEAYFADQIFNFYKWATDGAEFPRAKDTIQDGADALLPKYLAGPAASFTNPDRLFDPVRGVATTFGGSSIEPLIAVSSGKNYFGGDIIPREYQGASRELQQNETTSTPANWAAENLGIDAFTFDYLAQKFGGDIAKVTLPMTSDVGKGDPTGNMWDETLTKLKLLEDPVMKNRISEDYYRYANAVTQAKANNATAGKDLPEWYQTAYDEVTSQKTGSIAKQVSALNTQKKDTQLDTMLTAKQRSEKLRDIQTQINYLRIQGIKRLTELGVPETRD